MREILKRYTLVLVPIFLTALVVACGDDDEGGVDTNTNPVDSSRTTAVNETPAALPSAGGDDDGDDAPSGGDSCGLVTAAEVSQVMGAEYGEGFINGEECEYDDASFNSVYVTLSEDGDLLYTAGVDGTEAEEFDGPGDRSAWSAPFTALYVLDGDRTVKIQIADLEPELSRDRALALMEFALD